MTMIILLEYVEYSKILLSVNNKRLIFFEDTEKPDIKISF